MGAEFCVVCGRSDVPVSAGECADCFAARHTLVATVDRPTVVICPTCGARLVGSHWERSGSSSLLTPEDLLPLLRPLPEVGIRRASWEEGGLNPLLREIRATIDVRIRGTERKVAVEFPVYIEHRTCAECSRKSGHYYTSLLQLRGPEGRSAGRQRALRDRLLERWEAALPDARPEWRRALSWREERPEGWDFYLVDTIAAKALARWLKGRWRASLSESPTLYGRKDGHDLYRVTFCLRVPDVADAGPVPGRRGRIHGSSRSAPRPAGAGTADPPATGPEP